jgi:tetratricopeptide (TPR) repeat protein
LVGALVCASAIGCTTVEFQRDASAGVTYYNAGLAALERNDLAAAYSQFDMADFEFGFASRGYVLGAHYGTSQQAYESVNVYRAMARMQMGAIHLRTGQPARAVDKFTQALNAEELTPSQRAAVLVLRGTAHVDAGDRASAAADHKRAMTLDPRSEGLRRLGERLSR